MKRGQQLSGAVAEAAANREGMAEEREQRGLKRAMAIRSRHRGGKAAAKGL